jgi:hypothetical protein
MKLTWRGAVEAWVSRFGAAVGEGAVATKPITPRLAESLRLLAVSQLQAQAARSAALDTGALGVRRTRKVK